MFPRRSGGTFAPPLTEESLARYKALAGSAEGPVRDAMQQLLACVLKWWELPESDHSGSGPHPSGRGTIIPLDKPIQEALWDSIPWEHELEGIQRLFDGIPFGQADLRNAAFHLLWFVRELNLDREPITTDKI